MCDWSRPKDALQAHSIPPDGIQQSVIGIGRAAPNFSADAVVDNEITEYVSMQVNHTYSLQEHIPPIHLPETTRKRHMQSSQPR